MSHLLPDHQQKDDLYVFGCLIGFVGFVMWISLASWFLFDAGGFFKFFGAWLIVVFAIAAFFDSLKPPVERKHRVVLLAGVICVPGVVGAALVYGVVGSIRMMRQRHVTKKTGKRFDEIGRAIGEEIEHVSEISGTWVGLFNREVRVSPANTPTLVIGPEGPGKQQGVFAPTVSLTTGPVLSISSDWNLFESTSSYRNRKGIVWALDLGGEIPQGAQPCVWSPLSSVNDWNSAMRTAGYWMPGEGAEGRSSYSFEDARDWFGIVLYAMRNASVHEFAYCCNAGKEALPNVATRLEENSEVDCDAQYALGMLEGFRTTSDSDWSQISRILRRVTGSLRSDSSPNTTSVFNTDSFVKSGDSLYVAVPVGQESRFSGVIASLIGSIEQAQQRRMNESGSVSWVSVVFENASKFSDISIPDLVPQLIKNGLSVSIGIQDLSEAGRNWNRNDLLGIFENSILLPGIRDSLTLNTFSQFAGEFDRQLVSRTSGRAHSTGWFDNTPDLKHEATSIRTQRTRVVPVEAIAQMPYGEAMYWQGAYFEYVATRDWNSNYYDILRNK